MVFGFHLIDFIFIFTDFYKDFSKKRKIRNEFVLDKAKFLQFQILELINFRILKYSSSKLG